jgi:Zn-dependent peptidase ImmA (M78 family)/transcriptional regulator with XRE-family HTH domain
MQIRQRLKVARKAIGFTLERAANESGIGQSSLSDFENGKREPKFSQLSKLADVYRKTVEFFLTDEAIVEDVILWRDRPSEEEAKKTEAEFKQLCQQYRNLEVLLNEISSVKLSQPDVKREQFDYRQAGHLAESFQRTLLLGDIPSASVKQILEEKFYVKIFHLEFCGSTISTVSKEFGPAILLNSKSKVWRRNFDLGHELFHLLTWQIFREADAGEHEPSEFEEKLANAFASRLLLPTDTVKDKIEQAADQKKQISFKALDEIAREFGVSLEALLWRMLYLNNKSAEDIEGYIKHVQQMKISRPARRSDQPDKLPERYCTLAIRALREGKLSVMQFKKYMDLSYKEAEGYLTDEEGLTDEKISISAA